MFKKILTGILSMALLISSMTIPASAEDDVVTVEDNVLTVEDAVGFTLAADTEYLNLLDTGTLNAMAREDTINNYYSTFRVDTDVSNWLTTYAQLMQHDAKIALQKDNQEQKKLSLENTLTKYFINIINAEKDQELGELSLENTKADLKILETKSKLGHISQSAYNQALADYEKTLNDLKISEASIEGAYITLNRMMGKDLGTRYTLSLSYEYSEIGNVNLTQHINKALANNPNIKQKEADLEVAAYKLERAWWLYTDNPDKEDLDIQVKQARRSLDDAKEALRQSIITAYNDIKTSEIQISTSQIELKNMAEQMVIKETELALGKITPLDVDKYKVQILQAEEALRKQVYNHGHAVWQFQHPEIL